MRRVFLQNFSKNLKEYELLQKDKEFHHVKNVLRAKKGEKFDIFNGKGTVGIGEIIKINKNIIKFKINSIEEKTLNISKINIAVPVIKPNYFNFILKSLIQLKINKIFPYFSEYSFIKNYPLNRLEKWNQIIIEASKQSGNNHINFIEKIFDFKDITRLSYSQKICFDKSAEFSINNIAEPVKKSENILIAIGPEGGFSGNEINLLKENNFTIVKLNSNILRSEVATITALSIIKFLAGEL